MTHYETFLTLLNKWAYQCILDIPISFVVDVKREVFGSTECEICKAVIGFVDSELTQNRTEVSLVKPNP